MLLGARPEVAVSNEHGIFNDMVSWTCRLTREDCANQSSHDNQILSTKIGRFSKAMYVQLVTKHLDPADPITVLSSLPDCQWAFDTNSLHE